MTVFRAQWVFDGQRFLPDHTVVTHKAEIIEVRKSTSADGPVLKGIVSPGLINAHTHLELSAFHNKVPSDGNFLTWVRSLVRQRHQADPHLIDQAARRHAAKLVAYGTTAVGDITNTLNPQWLTEAGLQGVQWHELYGFSPSAREAQLVSAAMPDVSCFGVVTRPTAHAVYSTPPELLTTATRKTNTPASIHAAETEAENEFLHNQGVYPEIMTQMGVDWKWWTPPNLRVIPYLQSLNLLNEHLTLVHLVAITDEERMAIKQNNAHVVLCPRSNEHISNQHANLQAFVDIGLPFALGTDSLASNSTLNVMDEAVFVHQTYPKLPLQALWRAVTRSGANALGRPDLGAVVVGAKPGLLHFPTCSPTVLPPSPPRRWLLRAPLPESK